MSDQLKKTPDIAQIEELLHSIRPEPGALYHHRMASAPWTAAATRKKGVFRMKRKYRFAVVVAVVLILAAVFAITPVGSVLAGQIIHFFARTQGNTLPLSEDQILAPVPSATPEPTRVLALQPADQVVAPTKTATPVPEPEFSPDELQDLDLMAAEAAVGFDLYQPVRLPRDYRLDRIFYDPQRQAVGLRYVSPQAGSGEFFQITEGRDLEPLSVGPEAKIEVVDIGGINAEFVQGSWFVANGADEATWESKAEVYTLRWQVEDITVSAEFFLNESYSPAYLEQDEMLALAQDLVRCSSNENFDCLVSQASAAAGFTPWQFPAAPLGMSFQSVDYRPDLTALQYGNGMDQLTLLQSTHDFAAQEEGSWFSVAPDAIRSVTIAGNPGEYVKGQFMAAVGEVEAAWDPDALVERLRWKNGDWWFQIIRIGAFSPDVQVLVDLAGEVTQDVSQGAAANPQDLSQTINQQPDLFVDVTGLETRAGFNVLEPDLLPEGLTFSHARYEPFFGGTMLFYGSFAPDKMHVNGSVLVISQVPRAKADIENTGHYPPEALQEVLVGGSPGFFMQGSIETFMSEPGQPTPEPVWHAEDGTLMLTWKTEDMTFTIRFSPSSGGGRITREEMLKIAESLR